MEIQLHQQHTKKMNKFKPKNKFVGVRQRPSGRWVAEIKDTTQKIRMWLGTFETAEAAARAYDEAACLLRGSNTRTNFVTQVSANSPLAYRINSLLNNKKKTGEKQSKKQSIDNTTTSATSNEGIFSCNLKANEHTQFLDDAHGLDLSFCSNDSDLDFSYQSNNLLNIKEKTEEKQSLDVSGTSPSSTYISPSRNEDDFSCNMKVNYDTQLFDHAYKPDLSILNDDIDMGFSRLSNMSSSYGFAQEMVELHEISSKEMDFSEFERMKVERQISASLYAMNGVQEYMESVYDPNEAIWDLPTLCSLLC